MSQNGFQGIFIQGEEGEKEEEKISIPIPPLSRHTLSNMNMNATCAGINVGK